MKNKSLLLAITILLIGIAVAGGTYAYLTSSLNVTNANYISGTDCFLIDYTINNSDNTQDITGTLFPSSGPSGGLNGRVGIKVNSQCTLTGTGTLVLHVDSTTSQALTTPASSYCESRKTLEPLTEYTTKSACETAGGRWRGYSDPYCEDANTLQRLSDYTTESACTSNSGSWITSTSLSPLKYAVYDNASATGTPISKGRITSTDIGNDITLSDALEITTTQAYYYIFVWLDGYQTDNTHTNLQVRGTISASAIQNANSTPPSTYVYTSNIYDMNATGYNSVWIEQTMPVGIVTYNTQNAAITALESAYSTAHSGATKSLPFFLRHKIGDGTIWCATNGTNKYCIYESQTECTGEATSDFGSGYNCQSQTYTNGVSESYVGFVVTPAMATANPGMTTGTYYLKGGDNGRAYNDNIAVLKSAFGENTSYCTQFSSRFDCSVSGLNAYAKSDGGVYALDDASCQCFVYYRGYSNCYVS